MTKPDDPFDELVAGMMLNTPIDALPVHARDGHRVRLDPLAGESFRVRAKRIVEIGLAEIGLTLEDKMPLDDAMEERVVDSVISELFAPGVVRLGATIALTGVGILQARSFEQPGQQAIIDIEADEVCFGVLAGAAYGEFPYTTADIHPDDLADEDGNYTGPISIGPQLLIQQVAIYEREGIQSHRISFLEAYVPYCSEDFQIHAVLPE